MVKINQTCIYRQKRLGILFHSHVCTEQHSSIKYSLCIILGNDTVIYWRLKSTLWCLLICSLYCWAPRAGVHRYWVGDPGCTGRCLDPKLLSLFCSSFTIISSSDSALKSILKEEINEQSGEYKLQSFDPRQRPDPEKVKVQSTRQPKPL